MILPMTPIFASLNMVLQAQENESKRQTEEAMRDEDEQRTSCTGNCNYKREDFPYSCMVVIEPTKYCNVYFRRF